MDCIAPRNCSATIRLPSVPGKLSLDQHHRQCGEDPVTGIQLHGHSRIAQQALGLRAFPHGRFNSAIQTPDSRVEPVQPLRVAPRLLLKYNIRTRS